MSIKNKVVGIIQNKVSRRVAIGSIVGGLGGATLVLAVLRGMFRKPGKDANRHQVIRGGGTVEGTDEGGKGTWTAYRRNKDGSLKFVGSATVTVPPRNLPTVVMPERIVEVPEGGR